jgi:Amt family ammonium transporter
MVIGVVCAPFCYSLVEGIKNRLQIDDALDVFAVHGRGTRRRMCGSGYRVQRP